MPHPRGYANTTVRELHIPRRMLQILCMCGGSSDTWVHVHDVCPQRGRYIRATCCAQFLWRVPPRLPKLTPAVNHSLGTSVHLRIGDWPIRDAELCKNVRSAGRGAKMCSTRLYDMHEEFRFDSAINALRGSSRRPAPRRRRGPDALQIR